jgi:hypothetical protein
MVSRQLDPRGELFITDVDSARATGMERATGRRRNEVRHLSFYRLELLYPPVRAEVRSQ